MERHRGNPELLGLALLSNTDTKDDAKFLVHQLKAARGSFYRLQAAPVLWRKEVEWKTFS